MSKKLIVLLTALAAGWLWAQEASTSSTSTTISLPAKKRLSQSTTSIPSIVPEQEPGAPSQLLQPPKKRFTKGTVTPQTPESPTQRPEEVLLSAPAQESGSATPIEQEPEEMLPIKKRALRAGVAMPVMPEVQGPISPQAPTPEIPVIEAYFNPDSNFTDKLFPLLANANKQLLISMFSITDQEIVNKIIEVKKRKVDVQIIFDENTLSQMSRLLSTLLAHNILPIIYPSKIMGSFMHNKFLVIDNKIVVTGSANFSKKAFSNNPPPSNYENILIIQSTYIAQDYHRAFYRAKDQILRLYIKTIKNSPNAFPPWFAHLIRKFYEENYSFGEIIRTQWRTYTQDEQTNIRQFLAWRMPTAPQQEELRRYNISPEGMSRGHAFNLIAKKREAKKNIKRVREE